MRTPVMATQGTLQKSNQGCFLKVAPFQQWVHTLIAVPVSSSKPAMCPRGLLDGVVSWYCHTNDGHHGNLKNLSCDV